MQSVQHELQVNLHYSRIMAQGAEGSPGRLVYAADRVERYLRCPTPPSVRVNSV